MSNDEEVSIDSSTENVDERKEEVQEVHSIPAKIVSDPPPVVNKTGINARLDEAMKKLMRINRSSDLVPLTHDYEVMRKELKSTIVAAKTYKASLEGMDKARMDMVMKLSSLSTKSPIFAHVGNTVEQDDSLAVIAQAASKQTNEVAASYQDLVIDYLVEWERVTSSRVNQGVEETKKLHDRMNHYQTKVEGLRKKVHTKEDSPKGSIPQKLQEKLERNEKKLDQAWKEHERSASILCNLIEQVTARGWKDLAPLVLNNVQWEVDRTSGEYDIFARLPAMAEAMMETVEKATASHDESRSVAVALASEELSAVGSETTGSYHEEEEAVVEQEHVLKTPEVSREKVDVSKVVEQMPQSPDRVDFNVGKEV